MSPTPRATMVCSTASLTMLIALLTGWIASVVFKRDRISVRQATLSSEGAWSLRLAQHVRR